VRYGIEYSPEAVEDLRRFEAYYRKEIHEAIETHLRHEPTKLSRSRIKQLRGMEHPQFRLRVGDVRVFYDVVEKVVQVTAVVWKADADQWLAEFGEPSLAEDTEDSDEASDV
jgi:mRNA-degrading endonuclease RelE of RelBE toxin-antitoxin system